MKNTRIVLLLVTAFAIQGAAFAQKKGTFFKDDNPVCELWQYAAPEAASEEEAMELAETPPGAPILGDQPQAFFFLIPGGSEQSMMAPFYDPEMGFGCPSYFQASYDAQFIYCKIGESCMHDLPESEKFVAVAYSYDAGKQILTLTVNGKSYPYTKWSGE